MDVTDSGTYPDNDVVADQTYFYSAFTYSSSGAYNRNTRDRSKVIPKFGYIYGFDLLTTEADPELRVTYPDDVDNALFEPVHTDPTFQRSNNGGWFFTGYDFAYGDWPEESSPISFMPKPCMLLYDGTVDHYINPNDYNKKVDGTASQIEDTTFGGNAMMEWPKIYTHRELVNDVYKFRCSNVKVDEDWDCWCNYDKNNNIIEHFYTPIFMGSLISGKLRSIGGQTPLTNTAIASEITYAKANGEDIWYTEVLADRLLIQDLLVLMGKSTNLQDVFGFGYSDASHTEPLTVVSKPTTYRKGLFYGTTYSYTRIEDSQGDYIDTKGDPSVSASVKIFGMFDWWGNLYRRTAGWLLVSGVQKVKLTRGTHDGSTATDYDTAGSGYIALPSTEKPAGSSGGYIKTTAVKDYGRLPVSTSGGSSNTYEADGMWFNTSGTKYAEVGGAYNSTSYLSGPFTCNLSRNAAAAQVGVSLSCKPLAQ